MNNENKKAMNHSDYNGPAFSRLPKWLEISPDGIIVNGQHRLLVMIQNASAMQKPSRSTRFRKERTFANESKRSDHVRQLCWFAYSLSEIGALRLRKQPNENARSRAYDIFQHGFSAAMSMRPTTKDSAEKICPEALWQDYLENQGGKTVLEGLTLPGTTYAVVKWGWKFFHEGFKAGATIGRKYLNL